MNSKIYILFLSCFYSSLTFSQIRAIEIEGTKIQINTLGLDKRAPNQPIVVFESGLGTPMDNWDKVIGEVAEFAPILTYDRPGIGDSEAVDELPTIENVANRLINLLDKLALEPPYLLVGHSLGGLYVRGFANLYPELLAGLIIIDPADFTETKDNIRDHYAILDWEIEKVDSLIQFFIDQRMTRQSEAPAPIRNEGIVLESYRANDFKTITAKPLPNIPVHMITGGKFDMPSHLRSKNYDDEALFRSKINTRILRWIDVIQTVDKGKFFYSADSRHFVQWEDPSLVVSSIKIALEDYQKLRKPDSE